MNIGTTPTHTFKLPFNTEVIKELKITYAQDGQIKLEKRYKDCTLNEDEVSIKLTQEETFLFDAIKNIEVQMRILTQAGDALSSDIRVIGAQRCLDSEVLE